LALTDEIVAVLLVTPFKVIVPACVAELMAADVNSTRTALTTTVVLLLAVPLNAVTVVLFVSSTRQAPKLTPGFTLSDVFPWNMSMQLLVVTLLIVAVLLVIPCPMVMLTCCMLWMTLVIGASLKTGG